MYKRYLYVLCSVLCAFSIFLGGDIKSSADVVFNDTSNYFFAQDVYFEINNNSIINNTLNGNRQNLYNQVLTVDRTVYRSSNIARSINFDSLLMQFYFPDTFVWINNLYDYYLVGSFYSNNNFNFKPDNFYLFSNVNNPTLVNYDNLSIYNYDNTKGKGFGFSLRLDTKNSNNIFRIILENKNKGTINSNISFWLSIVPIKKGSTNDEINKIISAIQQQTNELNNSLGQINQSIKDQYSGDPNTEFNVNDFVTQHNNKMGVLSFGSDVMIQFLDIFTNTNKPAQLTLPGFSIEVEGKKHQVWTDHTFDFTVLDEWLPSLMTIIRTVLPIFIWLSVFRYIQNVFEKYFLSGGS